MADGQENHSQAATDHVIRLEEELEASGVAMHEREVLELVRARLHKWVDEVVAAVVSPGLGRVTVIHAGGKQSSITSPDLPFLLSRADDKGA